MSRNINGSSELKALPAYSIMYEEQVPDCHATGIVFKHIKSGARVCVISNSDENKVFMIGFRTPPADDTGVAHIIEHTVLCGSDKYPVKDPFMELDKGSLNTFLNAMTYPDKTVYPVASCNDKDFANLCDVYMDAVLHPNIYKNTKAFRQEGWHYEIADPDDPITINGIVYSEMKGAFSSPDSRIDRGIFSALFPDTAYGTESGGAPKAIPNLTYEQFIDFHKSYYHPSNSYIFLYGNMDIEERMEWLDSEYLSKYELNQVDSAIALQKPLGTREAVGYYPLGEEDPEENASYLAWAFDYGTSDDIVTNMAMDVLSDVLFNSPGAPVREAVIKAGIGQDLSAYVENDILQTFMNVTVRNTEAEYMPKLRSIIEKELKKLVKEGINHDSLLATINRAEFSYCEEEYGSTPKGLAYSLQALTTWLYDDSKAFTALRKRELFGVLRDKIETGFFEKLIEEYMLNSKNSVYYTLMPKRGLGAADDKELADRLADFKSKLTGEELDRLIADTKELKEYQAEESTPEELALIPMLSRDELSKEADKLIAKKEIADSIPIYHHALETNGIMYIRLIFDADMVPEDRISYLSLAGRAYGMMNTRNYSYLDLNNAVDIHTGGIFTINQTYGVFGSPDEYRPVFEVGTSVLEHGLDKVEELIPEIIFRTDFADPVRLRELLNETRAQMQYSMVSSGHAVARTRALACISSEAAYNEKLIGVEYYRFIGELLELSDDALKEAALEAGKTCIGLFGRDNVTIDIICSDDLYEKAKNTALKIAQAMPQVRKAGSSRGTGLKLTGGINKEALKISGDVNYVAIAGRFTSSDPVVHGKAKVVRNILCADYLYNRIRVLGGAYGAGFVTGTCNNCGTFHSFRDPKLSETLEVYRKAVDYLRNFEADERTMTKYLIGTVGSMDIPLSAKNKGLRSLARIMTGITDEETQAMRDAVLSTTAEDVRSFADVIEEIVSEDNYCVVGNENCINSNKDIFASIQNLI